MESIKKYISVLMVVVVLGFIACRDNEWDNHVDGSGGFQTSNILAAIQADPNLSVFYGVLEKTGYTDLLTQSTVLTVFAPQNDAWAGVDMDDVDALSEIVAHHISYGKLLTSTLAQSNYVKMIDTKNVIYSGKMLDDISIVSADNVAGNGVLHSISGVLTIRKNVYEYITSEYGSLKQVKYIQSLDELVMDEERSISKGVNDLGQITYDTIWTNHNKFLKEYPINNEDSLVTYIVLKDAGYEHLRTKYTPYFIQLNDTLAVSDSLTDNTVQYNICQDFVIALNGLVDIAATDTVVNVDGVKVPVSGSSIESVYEASNGRVYVLDQSNILLREKIKPIIIEGEDYLSTGASASVFVRYKLWASGEKDVMLNCLQAQVDTIRTIGSLGQDTVFTRTSNFYWNASQNRANVANCHFEYKATVNSANYEVYYVAYDDIEWHYVDTTAFRLEQKLFVSMPNQPVLKKGSDSQANAVINNYLGDTKCFVGQGVAGVHEETKLKQWTLGNNTTQLLSAPVTDDPDAELMIVPSSGILRMWLCNTTRSVTASSQGMLFLDYIKLVPVLPAE